MSGHRCPDCQLPGCVRPAKTRGMCGAHAERVRNGRPLDAPIRRRGVDFETLVLKSATGCWDWQGTIDAYGYGKLNRAPAHRLMYERHVGPIPDGLVLDHLCRNRACVKPAHLEPVTPRENTLRGMSPNILAFTTDVCQRGHRMTPSNVYVRREGTRMCRACQALREQKRRRT